MREAGRTGGKRLIWIQILFCKDNEYGSTFEIENNIEEVIIQPVDEPLEKS